MPSDDSVARAIGAASPSPSTLRELVNVSGQDAALPGLSTTFAFRGLTPDRRLLENRRRTQIGLNPTDYYGDPA